MACLGCLAAWTTAHNAWLDINKTAGFGPGLDLGKVDKWLSTL